MIKQRLFRIFIILIFGLAIAGVIAYVQVQSEQPKRINTNAVATNFGGEFSLIDQNGTPRTQDDFRGQYQLIYFGFTYCPAICPTELQRMATILKSIPSEKSDQIAPLFITVDPERDTQEVMKNYVSLFHPNMVGLTGTQKQTNQAKSSYKIYAAKVQDDTMSDYTMDHSSFIYFIDPNDNLLRVFKAQDSIEDMIKIVDQEIPLS